MASETAGLAGRVTQLLARLPLRNSSAIGYATWTAGWFLVFMPSFYELTKSDVRRIGADVNDILKEMHPA